MDKTLPSLMIAVGLSFAALPARAEDPAAAEEDVKTGEAAAPTTGEATTQAGAIGVGGRSTGGAGIQKGAKDKAPSVPRASSGGGGGGAVPSGESLDGIGAGADECAGLPPQKTTTVKEQAKLHAARLSSGPDAIDLRQVTFVKGVSIAGWNRVSMIKDVKVGGGSICIDHTFLGSGNWNAEFFGDKETLVEGNQWIFAFIKGRWYGGAGEWIRPAQLCKSVDSPNVGCGVFYDSEPLKSWRPARGELVGVAVSAPARAGQWSKAERSNVVLVAWP